MVRFCNHKHDGFTLLEVLISTSVIMVGIFGIASAIGFSVQIFKSSFHEDMAANCGRAALQTMKIQYFLNDVGTSLKVYNWSIAGYSESGVTNGGIYGTDFSCADHLRQNNAGIDLEANPPHYDTNLQSDYSWVGTILPISSEYCEVSAAVACKRYRDVSGSNGVIHLSSVQYGRQDSNGNDNSYNRGIWDKLGTLSGTFSRPDIKNEEEANEQLKNLRPGEYVFLYKEKNEKDGCPETTGHWYRVISLYHSNDDNHNLYIQFDGPKWRGADKDHGNNDHGVANVQLYTPGGVVGVYTQILPVQAR